jgi:hypothetical protein
LVYDLAAQKADMSDGLKVDELVAPLVHAMVAPSACDLAVRMADLSVVSSVVQSAVGRVYRMAVRTVY